MSRRPSGRRPALAVALLLTAGMALAGCSAGTVTQTDTSVSGAPGGIGHVGSIDIQPLTFDAGSTEVVAAGGSVPLRGTIVNQGGTADRLVAVSSPYAATIQAEGQTVIAGAQAVRMVGAEPGAIGPADPNARLAGTLRLTLRGVAQEMRPGPTYPVTFTFERSGTVTVPVIVVGTGPAAG